MNEYDLSESFIKKSQHILIRRHFSHKWATIFIRIILKK